MEILTIEDVCEITGYRKQTIYGKISSGTIPVIPKKPGQKFVRFSRSEIPEWYTNSKQQVMRYLDEFEYQYSKENTLNTAGEIYEWIKSKNRKGEYSDFTNLLTNHIIGLSDFVDSNDEKIKNLKHKSVKRKKTKPNETAIRFKAEKFFALHSCEKKEKFRRKWNNCQREIWWDHF